MIQKYAQDVVASMSPSERHTWLVVVIATFLSFYGVVMFWFLASSYREFTRARMAYRDWKKQREAHSR